jgi:hypothetical protein
VQPLQNLDDQSIKKDYFSMGNVYTIGHVSKNKQPRVEEWKSKGWHMRNQLNTLMPGIKDPER